MVVNQPIIQRSRRCATDAAWKSAPSNQATGLIWNQLLPARVHVTLSALLHCKAQLLGKEREFFLNDDFVDHVALMAWAKEPTGSVIVGGGRCVVVQPDTTEVAFIVIDWYQGQGLGAALMRHLAAIAGARGLSN
jgi:GNAT superfamily N-acetyltransferase